MDKYKKNSPYQTKSNQFVNLVKGLYGKTPLPISKAFRKKIAGVAEPATFNPDEYEKQLNPSMAEFNNIKLALNEKEDLLLELFPQVAQKFLYEKRKKEFTENPEKLKEYLEKKDDTHDMWDNLSLNM